MTIQIVPHTAGFTDAISTERERIEHLLLNAIPELKPLEATDGHRFAPYKNGGFMPSVLGFMLYCNGYSLRGTSRHCRNGLFYEDGETLFGVGIFRKTLETPVWHVMVSGPWGANGFDKVDAFVRTVRALGITSEVFVRHLSCEQRDQFLRHGYRAVDESPWCETAPSEDETYNHKRIRLADIIGDGHGANLEIRTLTDGDSRGHRVKARMVYNRFTNFLERNELTFAIRNYTLADLDVGEKLVRHHFSILKNPVGSTPEDYMSLVRCDPAAVGDEHFGRIGFLERARDGIHLPALLFLCEKTDAKTVAMYATFANRDQDMLPPALDPVGFSGISQYSYLMLFQQLRDMGIEQVDVGGSETEDLNKFKRQLGAAEVPSHWVVAPAA
ncbi:MAG: hypothetical protein ACO1PZ_01840 [Gammaproteobacteria bacterium]